MKLRLIISIAVSLLVARLRQTLLAAIGVTFSIAIFIALLGFMEGLNDLLDSLILNRVPHVRLYKEILPSEIQPVDQSEKFKSAYNFISSIKPKNERLEIKNSEGIIKTLREDKNVYDLAPKTNVNVIYNVGAIELPGTISGIDVEKENRLFAFNDYIADGNPLDLKYTPNSIILGIELAKRMLVKEGDIIQITTTSGSQFFLKFIGTYQTGIVEIDKVQSYTSLSTAQKLLGEPESYVTDIQVKLNDLTKAPELAKKYSRLFDVEAIDIQTANAQFETGSDVRTLISYAVGITLLIVSGFGIYNILNMMIYEKMESIAIMKATGFSGKDVKRIFIAIALGIGLFGGILGLISGYGLSVFIDNIPFDTPSLPKVTTYPIDYNPRFYMIAGIFFILTTFFSGYFPARRASKIDPVDVLRGK